MSFSIMKTITEFNVISEQTLSVLTFEELTYLCYLFYINMSCGILCYKNTIFHNRLDYYRLQKYQKLSDQVEQIELTLKCHSNLFFNCDPFMLQMFVKQNPIVITEHDWNCLIMLEAHVRSNIYTNKTAASIYRLYAMNLFQLNERRKLSTNWNVFLLLAIILSNLVIIFIIILLFYKRDNIVPDDYSSGPTPSTSSSKSVKCQFKKKSKTTRLLSYKSRNVEDSSE